MVYMSKSGEKWLIVQDVQGGEKVLFSADSFEAAWDAWISYPKSLNQLYDKHPFFRDVFI